MWFAFASFACISVLIVLSDLGEPRVVSRVAAPSVGSQPVPPRTGGDLESKLADITDIYPGRYGVVVYDSGATAEVEARSEFEAASLAKLPVLLALYREAAAEKLSLDEEVTMLASDVQAYGSGSLYIDHTIGHQMTLRECARLMIKESDNTAWVMLERRLGKARISDELKRLGAGGFDYDEYRTTPEAVMIILRAIADPTYTTPEYSTEMLEAMTDTAYEDRIPEPLPENVRVAHKVGSLDDTFSDAGIIFADESRKPEYFVVVIGDGADEDEARDAIRAISLATYRSSNLQPEEKEEN